MTMYIYPYRTGSKAVKALARALGIRQIKRERSRFRGSLRKTVINWGCVELPKEAILCQVLNHPGAVHSATNKLSFFVTMQDAELNDLIPPWTADKRVAQKWVEDEKVVVCRTVLAGHSGEGIVIAERAEDVVDAPLYTLYIPKQDEYRVHIVAGKVVDVARKARRNDQDDPNWKVRVWQNGFVFVRENCNPPNSVLNVAIDSFRATELDFGAVDVIYNAKHDRSYVLEINTAPGLEGQTIQTYVNALKEMYDEVLLR